MSVDSQNASIQILRRELRASMGDRDKLSKLHSVVTQQINNTFGQEKELLLNFRQDVRDALNCSVSNNWGAN